jgi:hypothetical protein
VQVCENEVVIRGPQGQVIENVGFSWEPVAGSRAGGERDVSGKQKSLTGMARLFSFSTLKFRIPDPENKSAKFL